MPQLTLSGTPNVRYPDPLVKKVNPNGTQRYTAYQAPLVWLNNVTRPEAPRYSTSLWQGYFPYGTTGDIQLLLFGADYIAKLSALTTIVGGGFVNTSSERVYVNNFTFSEVGAAINYANYILPAYNPINYYSNPSLEPGYKQIVTGQTKTNSLTVSGFPARISGSSFGLYVSDKGDLINADVNSLYLDVLMNGAVIDSTATYIKDTYIVTDKGSGIVESAPNIPVILWEHDLTQKIIDDGFIISDIVIDAPPIGDQLMANLEVVGLWGRTDGYTPYKPLA
jgi:hypothetical protein